MASPENVGMSTERLQRVSKWAQTYVDEGKLSGVQAMIARKDKVCYSQVFGRRDRENGLPMEHDTLLRIYSMTKPITSVAVMMLYEEGCFQLDDPVSAFIPELDGLKVCTGENAHGPTVVGQSNPITVRQLLTHTAGLSYGFDPASSVDRMYQSANVLDSASTLKEMVGKLSELPLAHEPGSVWRYSVATDVLGYLVEVVSGEGIDRFLARRVFEPLGMGDSGFHVREDQIDRFAQLYGPGKDGSIEPMVSPVLGRLTRPCTLFSGGGGLVSTAGDYMRFCRMLQRGGELDGARLLSPRTIDMMTIDHLHESLIPMRMGTFTMDGYGFGLGFRVLTDLRAAGVLGSVGEYAWGGAASTMFWIDPQEELIGILMTQFMPNDFYPIRNEFRVLVNQAIVD